MVTVSRKLLIAGLFIICLIEFAVGEAQAARAESAPAAKNGTAMVLLKSASDSDRVTLLAWDQTSSLDSTITGETLFEGVCAHCNIPMKFKADDAAKRCKVCPCSAVYTECLVGKTTRHNTWREMLDILPRGVALRVEFTEPEKPLSGVKRIMVDMRTVIVPLEKATERTDSELLDLLKSLGVSAVERADDGKCLRLTLKAAWTAERAGRLDKTLAQQGIASRFAPPVSEKS